MLISSFFGKHRESSIMYTMHNKSEDFGKPLSGKGDTKRELVSHQGNILFLRAKIAVTVVHEQLSTASCDVCMFFSCREQKFGGNGATFLDVDISFLVQD